MRKPENQEKVSNNFHNLVRIFEASGIEYERIEKYVFRIGTSYGVKRVDGMVVRIHSDGDVELIDNKETFYTMLKMSPYPKIITKEINKMIHQN